MQKMYEAETAALYASLGIEGTTYQVPYDAAVAEIGNLRGKRILDVGCGAGRSTEFLNLLSPDELIGLDHSAPMLEQARLRNLPQATFVLSGSPEAAHSIQPQSFDAVFAFSVYCEFSTRAEMDDLTREVFSYLKAGGTYVVVTTNPLCYGANFINFHYEKPIELEDGSPWPCNMHTDPPFVINDTYWTLETFDNVFCSNGFIITKRFFPLAVGDGWCDETQTAPSVVYCLTKPKA